MIYIRIDDFEILFKENISILEACKQAGITIPRFCYHDLLSVSGNCRMCLVEVERFEDEKDDEKLFSSCTTEIDEDMLIITESACIVKARQNVLETLLVNHPLDCPICDQAGECDLQDQTKKYGIDHTKFFFKKRSVDNKYCGPLIKTVMTRCIHCTRCIRYASEIAGLNILGTFNRGTLTEVGAYIPKLFNSEISGNIIDLCPVGALTAKPYTFKARPWELRFTETIDLTDSVLSPIYVNYKQNKIYRIMGKTTSASSGLISDKARFSFDALNHNRIDKLAIYNDKKSYFQFLNWNQFFENIDIILQTNQFANILINNEQDLKIISYLKTINNTYLNRIKFFFIDNLKKNSNFYTYKFSNDIDNIEYIGSCFLFSSNPKLEAIILNSKLRLIYNKCNFIFYSFGQKFFYNIPTTFVRLNISFLLSFIENKLFIFSKSLLSEFPLIITGDNFLTRFSDSKNFIIFLKKKILMVKLLFLGSSCNSEGGQLLNSKNLSLKFMQNKKSLIICINLDDTIFTRRILNNNKYKFIWINSHGSFISLFAKITIPTSTVFEDEKIYLDFKSKPQKAVKILTSNLKLKSTIGIISSILNLRLSSKKLSTFSLRYLNELVLYSNKYETIYLNYTTDLLKFHYMLFNFNYVAKYPIKSKLEDFYCSNLFSKNSLTMLECSKTIRSVFNNF